MTTQSFYSSFSYTTTVAHALLVSRVQSTSNTCLHTSWGALESRVANVPQCWQPFVASHRPGYTTGCGNSCQADGP